VEHFFGHLSEACLLSCHKNLAVVGLGIDEVAHVLVEIHSGQVFGKHVHVTFEGEAYANCTLMCKKLCKYLVENLAICERN